MQTRISLIDLELALSAVNSAHRNGRGALESAALEHGVGRSVVMDAIDRVEAAMGAPFFVVRVRRTGRLTPAGQEFRRVAPEAVRAWRELKAIVESSGTG